MVDKLRESLGFLMEFIGRLRPDAKVTSIPDRNFHIKLPDNSPPVVVNVGRALLEDFEVALNQYRGIQFLLEPFYASFLLKKSMVRCQASFAAASS